MKLDDFYKGKDIMCNIFARQASFLFHEVWRLPLKTFLVPLMHI